MSSYILLCWNDIHVFTLFLKPFQSDFDSTISLYLLTLKLQIIYSFLPHINDKVFVEGMMVVKTNYIVSDLCEFVV